VDSVAVVSLVVASVTVWLFITVYQVSTWAQRLVEAARTRDFQMKGQSARRRTSELLWTIPGVAVLSIILGFGVDVTSRLLFDGAIQVGLLALVVTILAGAFGGMGIVAFIIRKERPDYASIRADLRELEGERLTVSRIAEFRALLKEADLRQRNITIGRSNKKSVQKARAELEGISESFNEIAPVGNQAVRSIRWSVAAQVFWRAGFIGIIAALVSCVGWIAVLAYSVANQTSAELPLLLGLFGTTLISVALGIAGTRAALAARTAQHAVYLKQRAEIVDLLEEFDRTARKGVAGLGDRVARALQILRDQQG